MRKKIAVRLLIGFFLLSGTGWVEGGVTFYTGFEGIADASIAMGEKTANLGDKKPTFDTGIKGMALRVGDGEPFVEYRGEKNLPVPEGSIEMWVKPLDWKIPCWGFHIFFKAQSKEKDTILLYKFGHYGGRVLLYLTGKGLEPNPAQIMEPSLHRWTPREWRHIVGVWSKNDIRLYIDGERIKPTPLQSPFTAEMVSFWLGDDPWASAAKSSNIPEWAATAENRNAHTLIDEVYIYDRALTDEEVKWAFKNVQQRTPGEDIPLSAAEIITSMSAEPEVVEKRLDVTVEVNKRFHLEGATCLITLQGPEEVRISAEAIRTEGNIWKVSLPVISFPKGLFLVSSTLKDTSGKTLGEKEISFVSPGPPVWEGNKIGMSDTPPPPYLPVKVLPENEGFTCWNRKVIFDKAGFLKQVYSGGIPLLSGPLTLTGNIDGKEIVWKPDELKVVSVDKNRIVWEAKASSIFGRLKITITAEYDGMIRYDFVLTSDHTQTVNSFELRLPVRKEVVTSSCTSTASVDDITRVRHCDFGDFPELMKQKGVIRILKKPWVLYGWLGNDDIGISAVVESDEAWDEAGRKDAFRLESTDETVSMVWAFCAKEWKMPNPWRFTIGIQATPVKDISKVAWKWRYTPIISWSPRVTFGVPGGNFFILWTSPSFNLHFGYPQAKDEAKFKEWVKENMTAAGVASIPYSLLTNLSTSCPEYRFYFKSIGNPQLREAKGGNISAFGPLESVTPMALTSSYIDFLLWKNESYVRTIGFRGLYHDLSSPYPLTTGGFGYIRDGKYRPSYPVFALRSLYQRVYMMLKSLSSEKGEDFLMINHQTSYPWLGAYCDFAWVGEEVKEDYRRSLSPEKLRQMNTNKLGYRTLWLPESAATNISRYEPEKSLPEQPTRYLIGLLLLSDMELSTPYIHLGVVNDTYKAIDKIGGLSDTYFIPYWKTQEIVKAQEGLPLVVSAYIKVKPQCGALLCILNPTDQERKADFTLDISKLNTGKTPSVENLFTGEKISLSDRSIRVNIPTYDFLLIYVK